MFVSEAEVGQELANRFKGFKFLGKSIESSHFFKDYKRIGSALTNVGQVLTSLKQLEADLVAVWAERTKPGLNPEEAAVVVGQYYQQRHQELASFHAEKIKLRDTKNTETPPPLYPEKNKAFKGLLDTALAVEEEKAGFAPALDYMWSGLNTIEFLNHVRTRRPFKDYGANADHGEFTHRIQWYIVAKLYGSSKGVAAIYESLADWYYPEGQNQPAAWDALFDRADNNSFKEIKGATDFRSPNMLNRWIRQVPGHLPALSAYLQKRYYKRRPPGFDDFDEAMNTPSMKFSKGYFNEMTDQQSQRMSHFTAQKISPRS